MKIWFKVAYVVSTFQKAPPPPLQNSGYTPGSNGVKTAFSFKKIQKIAKRMEALPPDPCQ